MNDTVTLIKDFCESLSSDKNHLDQNGAIIAAICTLLGTLATVVSAYCLKRQNVQRLLPGFEQKLKRREEIRQSISQLQNAMARISPATSELGDSNADDVPGLGAPRQVAAPPSPARSRQKTAAAVAPLNPL